MQFTSAVPEASAALGIRRLGADHRRADGHGEVVGSPTALALIMGQNLQVQLLESLGSVKYKQSSSQ